MKDEEAQTWRDIVITNTVTSIAVIKVLVKKGICTDSEILEAVEETKKEILEKQQKAG